MKQTTNRTVIVLIMMMLTTMTAWANTETVSYIDADGNAQTVTATVLTGNEKPSQYGTIDLAAGWYVVKGDISYTNQISYGSSSGTIHIILADGAQMAVEYNGNAAIHLGNNDPLAIYGQSAGTGRLSVTSDRNAIYATGGLTINGGIVSATSTGSGSSAIYAYNGAITINGGQVTATPGNNAMGISTEGTITLGLRSTSDFITANGYSGTVNIKDGQTLYAGATAYSGNNVSLPSGTVTLRTFSSDDFSVNDAGTEYTIHTATGWNLFCDFLQDNDSWNRFSGKTVKLGADITVTRMAGSSKHDFCGTFDGQGYTLTFNYGSAESYGSDNYVAPFSYVSTTKADPNDENDSPAAFRNLHVCGDIYTSGIQAGGIVSREWGTVSITNCRSSVNIHSSHEDEGTHGGLVACVNNGSITIEGCLFDGRLLGASTSKCGGFIGYRNGTATIYNSLFAPAEVTVQNEGSATFARNDVDTHNCYYTYYLCDGEHYVPYYATDGITRRNGHATRTVAAADDVTIGAIALTGDATVYTVSGITAYSGGGLQRGETLYYGSGDQLSLTLSNSATGAPQGYQYGYTTNAGTLEGSTLTMPDEDVTISVNTADLAPINWATVNQGNSDDPYMIYNKDQLLLLAHRVNGTNGETANTYQGKYFKLGADITFSHADNEGDDYDENYEAIGGNIGGTYRLFNGKFDGDGYTVSGIRIRKDGSVAANSNQGLFGRIGSGADIHDVHLTDARIIGYANVGGIAGFNVNGYIWRCTVTDSYITATGNFNYGTICGRNDYPNRLTNNYYHGCTVNGTENATNVGCCRLAEITDITDNHGALPAYRLTLGANITTPPETFVGQTEWLDTPPASPRLAPGNGFTLAGNHYFASGYEFTPGSTLASGAAQGYTPRATLGGQLLDLYTPTGDDDLLAGTAIARLTITADCDGKTLASTEAIYSTRQPVTVAYIKADGTPEEASAIALDGHEAVGEDDFVHLAAGTYYVGTDIAYANPILLDGDITLILCDGCEMNVGESGAPIEDANVAAIDGYVNNGEEVLTIYGQTLGTGALNVYASGTIYPVAISVDALTVNGGNIIADFNGTEIANPIYSYGDININRGTVTATATGTESYGIYASGNITINGGNVNATAGTNAIRTDFGDVTINGGNVTASSIFTYSGDIILGWTSASDQIYASSYEGTVKIADGKVFTDGNGHNFYGTITDVSTLADKTLQPVTNAVPYIDADGNTAYCTDYTVLTDGEATTLQPGWYVVNSDINYTGTVRLAGDGEVNIILADGGTMNIGTSGNRISGHGIARENVGDQALTIYGQNAGTGALNVYTGNGNNGIVAKAVTINGGNVTTDANETWSTGIYAAVDDIIINGGTVNATATGNNTWGLYANRNLTINGGNVNASGGADGIRATANVAINGGNVTATGGTYGIRADGTITLGWTKPTNRITANSYFTYGTVQVAYGQALTDGSGHFYSGTLTASELSGFAAETTLQPCLALADAADNTAAITDHAGQTLAVALTGRTLYKDGAWNTLCLPFSLGDAEAADGHHFDGTPLEGADVMTLNSNDSGLSGTTLTLNFSDAPATIPAGTPFIVKWTGTDVENPVFSGVTIDNSDAAITRKTQTSTDGTVSFKGTYASITYEEENKSILFVGGNNSLYWPTADFSIGAQRAYFELNGGQQARNIVLNFDNDNATGISLTPDPSIPSEARPPVAFPTGEGRSAAWYTLDGRKLSGKPTAPGIYVKDGHKVAIK